MSSALAISTLYLEGEGRDHTSADSDVPSIVELSSFIDWSPVVCAQTTPQSPPGQVATPSGQLIDATRRPKIWDFYQFNGLGMNPLINLHFG